jgi:hypothetical protein
MGTLSVEAFTSGRWQTVWSRSGEQQPSQTSSWMMASVSLLRNATQVRFKGTKGSSYTGDMSVDSVTLSRSRRRLQIQPESSPACSFEPDPEATVMHSLLDDSATTIALPFNFTFWDKTYPQGTPLSISSNGFVWFGSSTGSGVTRFYREYGMSAPLPSTNIPGAIIAVYWADLIGGSPLDPDTRKRLHVFTSVSSTRAVIEWKDARIYATNYTLTFELLLYPNNTFATHYQGASGTFQQFQTRLTRTDDPVSIGWADGKHGVQAAYGDPSVVESIASQSSIFVSQSCHRIAGCDGVLSSGAVVDQCGVCGGADACTGCTDPNASNFVPVTSDGSITVENGSCHYKCDTASLTPLVWAHNFTDANASWVTLHGNAFADASGLHTDGSGDYAKLSPPHPAVNYAADADFTVSFWFTKINCTQNRYEYLYSHARDPALDIFDNTNSNINMFLSCESEASSLASTFIRSLLLDSRHNSSALGKPTAAQTGMIALFDWALPNDGDTVTQAWIALSLTVTPTSIITFVDGSPIATNAYGFATSWADCVRNPAYPNPARLHTRIQGFHLGPDIYIGGRADLDIDRHFWGVIAGFAIYDEALSAWSAYCLFQTQMQTQPALQADGCTDPSAMNYNPIATVDDGACRYLSSGTIRCPSAYPLVFRPCRVVQVAVSSLCTHDILHPCMLCAGCWMYAPISQLPTVSWVDTSSQPSAQVLNLADDTATVVQLPFSFSFFDRNYTSVVVADNGYVQFLSNTEVAAKRIGFTSQSGVLVCFPRYSNAWLRENFG